MKKLEKKRIRNGSPEWLEDRRNSIGGSDAAVICGLSEWRSPYALWMEKTGRISETPDNEAMRQGRDLEEYVAKRFCEATGKKVRRENAVLRDPKLPFAHANVDRMVDGEDAILECKTTSALNLKAFKNGEYPPYYYAQVMHYLMVTGAKKAYIAVVVLGKEFHIFEVERDEDEIASLQAQEEAFWRYVVTDTEPPVDGLQATTDALNAMYPQSNGMDDIDLTAVSRDLVMLGECKAHIKRLKQEADACENRIKAFLGAGTGGRYDRFKVTWKEQSRRTLDVEGLQRFVAIDLTPWYKTTTSRVFKFTELKQK